jgi:hypothetical protein
MILVFAGMLHCAPHDNSGESLHSVFDEIRIYAPYMIAA